MSSSASKLLFRRVLLPSNRTLLRLSNQYALPQVVASTTQIRFKHGAKRGQHIKRLEEVANNQEHEFGIERRKKHKEKEIERKSKHHDNPVDEDDEDDDESIFPDPKEVKERFKRHVEAFKTYLKGVRGSEPTPEMFDDVSITDAYGKGTGITPLKAVAQVVITSPTQATATCYDPSVAKAVVKSIQTHMNLNPQNESGGVIRIPLPRPSTELRLETVKALHKRAEDFRVQMRLTRSKSLKVVKQAVAGHLEGVSQDEAYRVQEEIEKIADEMIGQISVLSDEKEKTVMQI